jgi:hypothetical protein
VGLVVHAAAGQCCPGVITQLYNVLPLAQCIHALHAANDCCGIAWDCLHLLSGVVMYSEYAIETVQWLLTSESLVMMLKSSALVVYYWVLIVVVT